MARMVARKPLRLHGKQYKPGDAVPVERLSDKLRRQLIDQRRVVADAVRGTARASGGKRRGR